MRVKSILISQPEPNGSQSPYFDLADKYKVKIDFRPFIYVESVPAREFRKEKVSVVGHTGVVMTSKTAIENFFRICEETRHEVSADLKYFCISEAIALYLQKFITYRKRKVFFPKSKDKDLLDILLKHKAERFLFPRSNICSNEIPEFLRKNKFKFSEAVLYKTISSDLSDLTDVNYDVIAFFSPSGIKSLFENFPDFKQNSTRIAAFGPSTCQAVKNAGLSLNIEAPTLEAPSMKMALEQYIRNVNK
ncbi:MAG: uroporphyrinogen-III synthase [Bacteroidia bacterium]